MGGIARIQVQKALEAILEWWRPSRRVSTMDCEQFGRTAVLNGDFTHMPRSFFQNRTLISSHVYAWLLGLPWWLSSKESTCQCRRHGFYPWVKRIPWGRKWQSTRIYLPGKSHGQRKLGGYSPWGCKRVRHDLRDWTTTTWAASAEHEFWADFSVAEVGLNHLSPNSPFFSPTVPSHCKFISMKCIRKLAHTETQTIPGYPSTLLKPLSMWSHTTTFGVFTFQLMVWVVPEDRASWFCYFATCRCWWYSGAVICKLFIDLFGRPMKGMVPFLGKFMPIYTHIIFHIIPKLNQRLPSGINIP